MKNGNLHQYRIPFRRKNIGGWWWWWGGTAHCQWWAACSTTGDVRVWDSHMASGGEEKGMDGETVQHLRVSADRRRRVGWNDGFMIEGDCVFNGAVSKNKPQKVQDGATQWRDKAENRNRDGINTPHLHGGEMMHWEDGGSKERNAAIKDCNFYGQKTDSSDVIRSEETINGQHEALSQSHWASFERQRKRLHNELCQRGLRWFSGHEHDTKSRLGRGVAAD